jgi:TrmH family RNA methyltransferase
VVLCCTDSSLRSMELTARLGAKGCRVEEIPQNMMASLSDVETSQGLLAVLPFPEIAVPLQPALVVIADVIRDPGNLGTLIRSAGAAGVELFISSPGSTDPFSPKVVRSGMGAHFQLPIREWDWSNIRQQVKKGQSGSQKILEADLVGQSLWTEDLTGPVVLIIGGEADGASQEAREFADGKISIPMPGGSESLNAAVAGSILLFEVLRQRQK